MLREDLKTNSMSQRRNPFLAQVDGKMELAATSNALPGRDNSCARFRDTFRFTVARHDLIAA